MSRLVLIVAAVLLAGCASHSDEPDPKATAASDDARCRAAGLPPGTPEFERCLTKLADQRAQAEADSKSALAGRLQSRPPPGWDTSRPPSY
jgi:predicted outer membrane protein